MASNAEPIVERQEGQQKTAETPPAGPPNAASQALVVQQPQQMRATLHIIEMLTSAGEPELARKYLAKAIAAEDERALFEQDQRLATVFAVSGLFSDINGRTEKEAIAQAMTKVSLGRSWHMCAADAMQYVFFTNGRPSVMQEAVAAKLNDSGMTWDVEYEYTETPSPSRQGKTKRVCVGCTLYLKTWDPESGKYVPLPDRNGEQVSVSFDKDDADTAMIWEKGQQIRLSDKWNFKSWAEDMYYWRCISRVRRRYRPNIFSGVPTREEAEEYEPVRQLTAGQSGPIGQTGQSHSISTLREKLMAGRPGPSLVVDDMPGFSGVGSGVGGPAAAGQGSQAEEKRAADPEPKRETRTEPKPKVEPKQDSKEKQPEEKQPETAKSDDAAAEEEIRLNEMAEVRWPTEEAVREELRELRSRVGMEAYGAAVKVAGLMGDQLSKRTARVLKLVQTLESLPLKPKKESGSGFDFGK